MNDEIRKLSQIFASLSDETRLKIVISLMDSKKTVGELHHVVGVDKITLSGISHQLKQLSSLNLIVYEKIGREKYYEVAKDFCWCIVKNAMNHFDSACTCGCSGIKIGTKKN